MPTPGYVFKDSGVTPPSTPPSEMSQQPSTTNLEPESTKGEKLKLVSTSEEAPTESHALAVANQEEKGAVQEDHGAPEVNNVGWSARPKDTSTLVGGLPNEELWTLVRRFNKV